MRKGLMGWAGLGWAGLAGLGWVGWVGLEWMYVWMDGCMYVGGGWVAV